MMMLEFTAKVLRVIDGGTLVVEVSKREDIDWGFNIKTAYRFTHKLHFPLHGLEVVKTVEVVTKYVKSWLDQYCAQDRYGAHYVFLRSYDGKKLVPGKYPGRWIAEIMSLTGQNLNEDLIKTGHAVEVKY